MRKVNFSGKAMCENMNFSHKVLCEKLNFSDKALCEKMNFSHKALCEEFYLHSSKLSGFYKQIRFQVIRLDLKQVTSSFVRILSGNSIETIMRLKWSRIWVQ